MKTAHSRYFGEVGMRVQHRPALGVPVGPQCKGESSANVVIKHQYSSRPSGGPYDRCSLRVIDLDQPSFVVEIPDAASVSEQGRAMLIQGKRWTLARTVDINRVWNE